MIIKQGQKDLRLEFVKEGKNVKYKVNTLSTKKATEKKNYDNGQEMKNANENYTNYPNF